MKRICCFGLAVLFLLGLWGLISLQRRPSSVVAAGTAAQTNRGTAVPTPASVGTTSAGAATGALPGRTLTAQVTAANTPSNQPPPFDAFANWAQRYLAGDSTANAAQGEALAWKRREAMLELIKSDPAKALQLTVPFRWRQALPPNIRRHFEERVDGRGSFEVAMSQGGVSGMPVVFRWAVIGGKRYNAFVYGRRLSQPSRANIPLHGIVLDDNLALYSDPVRMVEPDEAFGRMQLQPADVLCSVSGQAVDYPAAGVAADIGGEVRVLCSGEHFSLVNERWLLAENGGGFGANLAAGGGSTWTQGRKSVLYMRVNFPDDLTEPNSETAAYTAMNSVNAFYVTGSYDTTWLTTTVTPLLTLPQVKGWYSTAMPFALLSDARETARKAGFDTDNYNLDIVSHTAVPEFNWGGLGFVGGKGAWLQSPGAGVTAHELGHNYGLPHANFWDTTTNYHSVTGVGTNREYGNLFDTMGAAGAGNNQFSAVFKNSLNWLPNSAVQDIITNGVYRIYAFDVPRRINGRSYAAKTRKDFDRDYWLEFRQAFLGNVSLQNGVLLNWSPWNDSNGGASMLDTTPNTDDVSDSAVVIGRTFSDLVAAVHITPLARGATGSDPWIDVQVNLGSFPLNRPPLLTVEIGPTNATPGQPIRFHATASDPDGDTLAYAWSFDDNTFSTNNQPWIFKTFSGGEHVVRCVVSDMKGGATSANVVATVGAPTGSRLSGVVLDANDDPIEGVRVGATNLTLFSYTDSDGGFILTGLSVDPLFLDATKYGYVFTNLGSWVNPLQLSSNLSDANFRASFMTNVNLTLTTNVVMEGSGTGGQLTLTRNSTNDDLTVNLFVSGTAGVPADLVFSPALSSGPNPILMPAGTGSITFSYSAVNNATVENPETVAVTILNDTNFHYVITPDAEARITILDDDQPVLPLVSIVAGGNLVPETGVDSARFVFSRTGPTTNNLPVFYSFGGTATPGTDYPTPVGVVVIPAGSRSGTVEIRPTDDKDVEPDETVSLTITPNGTYNGGGASANATIVDDDLLVVTISPTGSGLAEPAATGRFTIKRDGDQTANLVVYYTLGGSASNGVDYVSPSGAVIIPAGQASTDLTITPLDDALIEGDESVIVTLTSNPGYDIGTPGSARLFLRDDEKANLSLFTTDATASEPGDNFGAITISRGSVVNGNLTVDFIVNGTAIAGADYVPLLNPVVIPDGASSITLDIIPFDDLHIEPVEDVIVTLAASTNYNVGGPAQARVGIEDDDGSSVPAVGFTFAASKAPEDESPGVAIALSLTSAVPVTVSYRMIPGGTASSTTDFTLPPGTITLAPGERAKSIPLPIIDDSTVELDETIRLTVYDPTNATLDGIKIHTYTIVDNDSASVSVSVLTNASETGPAAGIFRIARGGSTNASVPVNFQITGTADAPSDFAPLGTSVTIPAGAAFLDVPVVPANDGVVELDETVVMTLISAPGARIVAPANATITILDNDPDSLPVVAITSTNQPYAVEGGGNGAFVFTRGGSTTGALTVEFTVAGTAGNGVDYVSLTNNVTIPIGQSSITLPIVPLDDGLIEGEESVIVALTVRDTYRAAYVASATVTIQDNDQNVRVEASDFDASEPGSNAGAFTFTRFGTTNTAVQVFFAISGTASNGLDYTALSGSFVIPAGSLTATLPIIPLDDPLIEGPESVTLTLQSNPAYSLASPTTATVIIMDDEPMVSIVAAVPDVVEGSKKPGVLKVVRGGSPNYEFVARLAISGTATYGVDYPPFLTNILFNCGVMAVNLQIFPTNELVVESTETVTASVVPSPSYSIVAPSNAVVSIQDAGTSRGPVVTITSPTASPVYLLGADIGLILEATVLDDGDTNTLLTLAWTNVSGPDSLVFSNADQLNATVSFTNGGVYTLRLTADENLLTNYAEVTVMVDTLGLLSSNLLYWPFNDGAGTNVADASGNGHNGAILGAPNWVTNGISGGALRLNGTNNLVREAPASAFLNGRKQFSLALWVRPDSTNSDRGLFSAEDSVDPTLSLATRTVASCGGSTNVIEATLASSRGDVRLISERNMTTNNWQHIALTWSNGLAPAMFINGRPDHPLNEMVALRGALANCHQFIIGKGPVDVAGLWNGVVDDVRVFPRALSAVEVGGLVATNYGPIVEVPTNITVQVVTPVQLSGTVTDDGRPNPPGVVSNTWVQIGGPATVTIPAPHSLTNTVQFVQSGEYVFRLIAADGQVKVFKDLIVTVVEPTQVSVFASDSDAAELGPDTGQLTFMRFGDLNFNLLIQVVWSGTASNGIDFALTSLTNTVLLPTGVDTVSQTITPFLDHRTEGDETVTVTIITNLAYTVGNASATVTIHDSPYGVWNIANFTLEELTDPALSGEGVDFDHDGYVNFVEYAANRNPRAAETNAVLVSSIETNHITITYQRRLEPTDVSYEVQIANSLLGPWHAGTNYVEELAVTDDGNNLTETVKARLVAPWPPGPATQFVTIRVWLRATGP